MEVSTTVAVLLLCSFVQISSSACFMSLPEPKTGGKPPTHCEYQNFTLSIGGVLTDFNKCAEYRCHDNGAMVVCGIGIYAGVHVPPQGCAIVRGDKCSIKYVDISDHSIQCQNNIIG